MVSRRITLDAAAFVDSAAARALGAPRRAEIRKIAEIFLAVCYEELGTKPSLLEGESLRAALAHRMPGHFARRDPLAEHVPAVLSAFFEHLGETQVISHAYEIESALGEAAREFVATVRAGRNQPRAPAGRERPKVHRAPKLGRNDPCFCGSGKKFKKCHGAGRGSGEQGQP